jgi:hypothetical protein
VNSNIIPLLLYSLEVDNKTDLPLRFVLSKGEGKVILTIIQSKGRKRKGVDDTTYEQDFSPDELEFMNALDRYKKTGLLPGEKQGVKPFSRRPFPTWKEVLSVAKALGYRKEGSCVCQVSPITEKD